MPGSTQLNIFTNHIALDNKYMRCGHDTPVPEGVSVNMKGPEKFVP